MQTGGTHPGHGLYKGEGLHMPEGYQEGTGYPEDHHAPDAAMIGWRGLNESRCIQQRCNPKGGAT